MADLIMKAGEDGVDIALAKNIAEQIMKELPGYTWAVYCDSKGGVGSVFCVEFSLTWGFVFKLDAIAHDPSYKIACRGAAEILERLGWTRGRAIENQVMTHKEYLGTPIFDYNCSKNTRVPDAVKYAYDKLR